MPAVTTASSDRADAYTVLRRLRDAGHVAYFAGGCVRDVLLGKQPKDWDVATDATPDRVRQLFPRTQAVGAAFGVILVRQGRSQIEVATFRSDGAYLDGRRPEAVTFTDAEHDAKRRDFTINGLFLDPDGEHVIDYVGGRDDLKTRVVRAIGEPRQRFGEDYLRMLRAVRFAARLNFSLDPATAAAVRELSPMLTRISPERIADELRVMLPPPTRLTAWRLLHELGLAQVIFRFAEVADGTPDDARQADGILMHLAPEDTVPFGTALAGAALQWLWWATPRGVPLADCLYKPAVTRLVQSVRKALRTSNEEDEWVARTLTGLRIFVEPQRPRLATLKRFLADPTAHATRQLAGALAEAGEIDPDAERQLQAELSELEQSDFAPPPLITGDDLAAAGCKPGPRFRVMLETAYDAQLEGRVLTRDAALRIALEAGG